MNFKNIIGHKDIIEKLVAVVKTDKLSHAYAFNGPIGVGKRTLAMEFAGLLLCTSIKGEECCGQCQPCRLFLHGSNPDFSIIQAEDSSIGVGEIRKLQQDVMIAPMYSPRKVYLIKDADNMTLQAQNCLLKTLEEPPEHTHIILTVSNYNSLLETVRSRLVKYEINKNTYREVFEFLQKKHPDFEDISFVTSYADGIIGKALKVMESSDIFEIRNKIIKLLFDSGESKLEDMFCVSSYFEENKNKIDFIFDIMIFLYRDILMYKKTNDEAMLINSDKRDIIMCNSRATDSAKVMKNIGIIENTRNSLKQNANFQLAIEVMLMKLWEE